MHLTEWWKQTYQNCFLVNWNSICSNSGGDSTLLDFLFSPFATWGLKNQWCNPLIVGLVIREHDSNSRIHLRIASRKDFEELSLNFDVRLAVPHGFRYWNKLNLKRINLYRCHLCVFIILKKVLIAVLHAWK